MKKRLLALALCLALAVSLLPITAAAAEWHSKVFVGLKDGGVYCEDVTFELRPENFPAELGGGFNFLAVVPENIVTFNDGIYTLHVNAGIERPSLTIVRKDGECSDGPNITLKNGHAWGVWTSNGDGTHSRTCGNGCVTPPQKEFCADNDGNGECDTCGDHIHSWQVHFTENSLKAKCAYSGCTLGEVGVTLNAHSVTLPESPFHATVDVTENFKEAFPGAEISDILYQYNDSGSWSEVDPKTFTPKPGEYQAGVSVSGIPMGEDAAALSTNDGANQATGSAFLFVKYTAADPKVTAQTGDNRPIEIMMAGAAVFSVLAAAAFILDSKRRYQR